MKKKLFLIFLIPVKLLIFGQSLNDLPLESYKIYSAVLDSYFACPPQKFIVLSDSTMLDFFYRDSRVKYEPDSLYLEAILSSFKIKYLEEIMSDYSFKKKTKYKLRRENFLTKRKLVFINHNTFNKYFKSNSIKKGWRNFYSDFPNSIGYIKFTKVGFNQLKNYAIVYVEKYCGGTCGSGMYFLLKKEKNVWKIIDKKEIWVS